jgi:hypothetical protein
LGKQYLVGVQELAAHRLQLPLQLRNLLLRLG